MPFCRIRTNVANLDWLLLWGVIPSIITWICWHNIALRSSSALKKKIRHHKLHSMTAWVCGWSFPFQNKSFLEHIHCHLDCDESRGNGIIADGPATLPPGGDRSGFSTCRTSLWRKCNNKLYLLPVSIEPYCLERFTSRVQPYLLSISSDGDKDKTSPAISQSILRTNFWLNWYSRNTMMRSSIWRMEDGRINKEMMVSERT